MTIKEQITLERYEHYLHHNKFTNEFLVEILKLTLSYGNAGSAAFLAEKHGISPQYVHREFEKVEVNGVKVYVAK